MKIKYYTLSYRTMRFEGKGEPAGFSYDTYVKSTNKADCMALVRKHSLELVDEHDAYADGFVIDTHEIELDIVTGEDRLVRHAQEDARKRAEYEAAKKAREERKARGEFNFFDSEFWTAERVAEANKELSAFGIHIVNCGGK